MYKFEAIHEILPEQERLSLSGLFTHELMGEIALEWGELIRASIKEGLELIVIKIYKGSEFIGIGIVSIIRRLKLAKYLWKPLVPFVEFFAKFDVGFVEIPFSNMPGLLTVKGINEVERGRILNGLVDYVRETIKLGMLCVKVDDSIEQPSDSPFCKGMVPLSFYPNTLLKYPYKSLDDFLNSLTRKKWRKCRVDRRALAKYNGSVEVNHDIASISSQIYALYKNTTTKVKKRPHYIEMPVSINEPFFSNLEHFKNLKPCVLTVKVNDVIIAYSLLMQSGNTIFFKAVGLDYDLSYKTRAYFNLVYATLKYAAERKCDKVDFGVTSYQFKKWIGCELHSATYLCGSSNPLIHLVKKPLAFFIERRIGTGM